MVYGCPHQLNLIMLQYLVKKTTDVIGVVSDVQIIDLIQGCNA